MRLVTWNIHGGVGTDGVHDPDRIVEVLAGLDADVIGLQEIVRRRSSRGSPHQLDLLARELGMEAVDGPNLRDHAGAFGNGLLVRGSILADRRLDLSEPRREPRGVIDADVLVHGRRLRVLVTHLGLRRGERRRQLRAIRELLEADPGATPPTSADITALLGDLNEWFPVPRHRDILRRTLLPGVVGGRSFPSRAPALPLDRILLAPAGLEATGGPVGSPLARIASDHLPVVADVQPPRHGSSAGGTSEEAGPAADDAAPLGGIDAATAPPDRRAPPPPASGRDGRAAGSPEVGSPR